MTWKFWEKKRSGPEFEKLSVPASTIYRWYCYDVGIKDVDSLDRKLGLTPISSEGKTMEMADSDVRLSAIQGLLPFLEMVAGINAEAMTSTTFADLFKKGGVDEDSEELETLLEALHVLERFISYSGLVAAFSAATRLGLIKISSHILSEVHDHD